MTKILSVILTLQYFIGLSIILIIIIYLYTIFPKMNSENRYPVTASLFMLKEMKRRQEQVNKGFLLLKRKAEALRIKGRQAAIEMSTTQAILGHTLKEAYISLAAIKFTNGESNALVLENIGEAQIRVQRIPENIAGVATFTLEPIEDTGANDVFRYAGLGSGGHRTAETKKAFRDVIYILIKFASLRNTCIVLDEAIRTTLRKVNGIQKVIMPKLHNTETYILLEMDEREREDFHRLKMVKAKKIKHQILANSRVKNVCESADLFSENIKPMLPARCVNREDYLTSVICRYNTPLSSTTDSSGDFKPICYPHNWDDDDLLF